MFESERNGDIFRSMKKTILSVLAALLLSHPFSEARAQQIKVVHSGVVILKDYIPMLMERLKLTNEKNVFINDVAQDRCVIALHYLATGLETFKDEGSALLKVLCGLPEDDNINSKLSLSTEEKELIKGLLSAAISHWTALGNTSVDGLRGNFLVRDGLLVESQDRWDLTVQKRAYDVIINRSPFSFSRIKFPWMSDTLNVSWDY